MKNLDDKSLIDQIVRSDTGAVEELYNRYGRYVFSLAFNVVGNREAAEGIRGKKSPGLVIVGHHAADEMGVRGHEKGELAPAKIEAIMSRPTPRGAPLGRAVS